MEIPSEQFGFDPMVDTNFAPVIFQNGSLYAFVRGQAVYADDWKDISSYHKVDAEVQLDDFGEDPDLWVDKSGRLHMLTHSECGKHFFSVDGTKWQGAPLPKSGCAYPTRSNLVDGTVSNFGRRERPSIVLKAGTTTPIAVTSAVTSPPTTCVGEPDCVKRWPDASFTFLQPVKQGNTGFSSQLAV